MLLVRGEEAGVHGRQARAVPEAKTGVQSGRSAQEGEGKGEGEGAGGGGGG